MSHLLRFFLTLIRLLLQACRRGAVTVWRWLRAVLGRPASVSQAPGASENPAPGWAAPGVVTGLADQPPVPVSGAVGRFMAGVFKNEAGERDYKLYLPAGDVTGLRPLLVMLHGCKQSPDDFALGTRMNALAQSQGCLVLYPGQSRAANGFYCWNWFHPGNQQREGGEPAIIAGMIRDVTMLHGVDPQRIYAAGLSAGAAMAVTLAHTHPELLAAVGAHSGVPHGAARNMISALVVMKRGAGRLPTLLGHPQQTRTLITVPLIVFQGDQDTTVHPRNGEQLMGQAGFSLPAGDSTATASVDAGPLIEQGQVVQGHRYTRTRYRDPARRMHAEHWLVHGAGHAWSGGNSQGSYTDPRGPDASAEFLRFFLSQGARSLQ